MIKIMNATVLSKISYGTIPIEMSEEHSSRLQKITPIPALNVESNMVPTDLFIRKHTIGYVARQRQVNSHIYCDIKNGKSTKRINKIYEEENIEIIKIPIAITCEQKPTNLLTSGDLINGESTRGSASKKRPRALMTLEMLAERYPESNQMKIYTDGSRKDTEIEIGIYNEACGEKIAIKIKENVSIKTAEIVAITFAMQIGATGSKPNVTIITDSKISCNLIATSLKGDTNRYYEN